MSEIGSEYAMATEYFDLSTNTETQTNTDTSHATLHPTPQQSSKCQSNKGFTCHNHATGLGQVVQWACPQKIRIHLVSASLSSGRWIPEVTEYRVVAAG